MSALSPEEQQIVDLVARWVDDEVRPVVNELEHSNTYPEKLIEQMKQMGVYGLVIPEPYGDFAVSARCYAQVTEEIARGWMSLAGAFGGHSVVSKLILRFGTEEQRRALPAADGDGRAAGDDGADRARRRVGPASDPHRGATSGRRVRHQRLEDVDHERPHVRPRRAAVQDRPRRRTCAHRDLDPARREGPGLHGVARPAEARVQGRRVVRAALRRLPRRRPTPCSAASRARASAR